MKKILVSGGCGFIGSNFVRLALQQLGDCRLINLDKLTYAGNPRNLADIADDARYRFVKGDICDSALVNELFITEQIDTVVHFAAESHVDRSITGPAELSVFFTSLPTKSTAPSVPAASSPKPPPTIPVPPTRRAKPHPIIWSAPTITPTHCRP
jgi:hypothetical protein